MDQAAYPATGGIMSGRLNSFWDKSLYDKLNLLGSAWYRLKGILLYRLVFNEFGAGSQIIKPLLISNPRYISVGSNVLVRNGVRLEAVISHCGRVPDLRIGSGTNIEQNVHIVCHNKVHIGENVSVTGQCAIVDVTHPFEDVNENSKIGARVSDDDACVIIGDNSFLGFGTVVLPNVTIGKYVITGARSVVTHDLPDYCVAAGAPARVLRRYIPQDGTWTTVDALS